MVQRISTAPVSPLDHGRSPSLRRLGKMPLRAPTLAGGLAAGLLLAGALLALQGQEEEQVRGGVGTTGLLSTDLSLYAVNGDALREYLAHTSTGGRTMGARQQQHDVRKQDAAAAAAPAAPAASAVSGRAVAQREAVASLQGIAGVGRRLAAKASGPPKLELFLSSSTVPEFAKKQMQVVPRDESQMLASVPQLRGIQSLGGGVQSQQLAETGGGQPCSGPVTHTDSPECVAKKALSQALQAEKDVDSVRGEIGEQRDRNKNMMTWVSRAHDALSKEMDKKFDELSAMIDRNNRRVDAQGRQITTGDMNAQGRESAFAIREAKDMKQVSNRINRMNSEVSIISRMEGPPGPRGPPGVRGFEGVRGPQGVRGPPGDQGPQGSVGPRGSNGLAGSNGHRGPAGHFLRLKGALGKMSTKVDEARLRKFADNLRNLEQMVHRIAVLRKPGK